MIDEKKLFESILAIKQALIEEDINEAYHHLYMLAESFSEDPYKPWSGVEKYL